MTEGVYDKRKLKTCQSTWGHNRLSHVLEKNEVPDTLNGFLVKYEDATIIIPDSTLCSTTKNQRFFKGFSEVFDFRFSVDIFRIFSMLPNFVATSAGTILYVGSHEVCQHSPV